MNERIGAPVRPREKGLSQATDVIDDVNLHEWAEFNVPAELRDRPIVLSPLARRVLSPTAPSAGTDVAAERRLPTLSSLLLPAFGFRTLPKP